MIHLLLQLWRKFEPKRRWQLISIIFLMSFASMLEVAAVGSIMPFLAALADPELFLSQPLWKKIVTPLIGSEKQDVLFFTCLMFCLSIILLGLFRFLVLFNSQRVGQDLGSDLSTKIFNLTLSQPFLRHTQLRNTDVLAGITVKAHTLVSGAIMPVLNLFSACLTLLMVVMFLVYVDPVIAVVSFLVITTAYLVTSALSSKKLISLGQISNEGTTRIIKIVQEGFGGIRDVILYRHHNMFAHLYETADRELRRAFANIQIISGTPRYVIEVTALVAIAILAYSRVSQDTDFVAFIPTLGALAIGGQRLLPMMQQVYASWSSITSSTAALRDVVDFLNQTVPDYITQDMSKALNFKKTITANNLYFSYDDGSSKSKDVVSGISFRLIKGSKVGIIGKTGSGKSTVLDLIMGLLYPSMGNLRVDDVIIDRVTVGSWQRLIGHVPQRVFIKEGSIFDNVAFGFESCAVDVAWALRCVQICCLEQDVDNWERGLDTIIAHGGANISGGQAQRIGIARALYRKPQVLILDEATNALDPKTERQILSNIASLLPDITLLTVTHRILDHTFFDEIFKFENGKLNRL